MEEVRRIGAGGNYTIILKRSGDQYVTLCLELEVAGMGYTPEEALENTELAIESYLEAMEADSLPAERPVPLNVLHEFLAGEEGEIAREEPKLKVLAYAWEEPHPRHVQPQISEAIEKSRGRL